VAYFDQLRGQLDDSLSVLDNVGQGRDTITVNGKPMESYFTTYESRDMVNSPIKTAGLEGSVDVSVQAQGGGQLGQADAVRLGISRALIELNPTYRKTLKKLGFLMRDPRAKERKKPGLKKARRAPQWSKR
jgi:small subunit ribosomal protein S9